jgi:hypothetical protein
VTPAPARPPAAERGATVVAERVVRRIAERAATEAALPHGRAEVTRGAATVRGGRADLALGVRLPYPAALADTGAAVRDTVTDRVAYLTGLTVTRAAVQIRDLSTDVDARGAGGRGAAGPLAEDAAAAAGAAEAGTAPGTAGVEGGVDAGTAAGTTAGTAATSTRSTRTGRTRTGRTWAQRRGPAGVVALVVAAGAGVLLWDVVSVHAAGRRPARWRLHALDWVTAHGPGDTAVVAGGAGVAVVGLWLLLLALTPGRRALLTMAAPDTPDTPDTPSAPFLRHAVLERSAAARLVADTVLEVAGVTGARVRVGRRRVRVRATLGFGDLATARAQAVAAARTAATALGLARTPRLRVHLRRSPQWRPSDPRTAGTPTTRPESATATDTAGATRAAPAAPSTTAAPRTGDARGGGGAVAGGTDTVDAPAGAAPAADPAAGAAADTAAGDGGSNPEGPAREPGA